MLGVLSPCKGGNPIPLTKPKLLVGRKPFCDVTLPFPNVSSRHCELLLKDGFWYARDLDSTNGTTIDGRGCQQEQDEYIKPGSVLGIGRHRFTFQYESEGPEPEALVSELAQTSLMDKAGVAPDQAGKDTRQKSQPAQRGHLIPAGGGSLIVLNADHLVVGRDRGCDIRLPSSGVSARHCELELIDGYWLVRDLGSRNGTKVDGKKIEQKWLYPKCVLHVSNLRFTIMYSPPPGVPRPKDQLFASFTRSLLDRAGLKRRR